MSRYNLYFIKMRWELEIFFQGMTTNKKKVEYKIIFDEVTFYIGRE